MLTHLENKKENILALPLIKQHLCERGHADLVEDVEWIMRKNGEGENE